MPIRPCLEAACPDPATYRGRCQRHAKERELQTHRNKSFYNSARWKNTRRAVLRRDPICKVCDERLSTEADHIVPLSQGGDPWNLEGLQGICGPCHGRKTRREQGA